MLATTLVTLFAPATASAATSTLTFREGVSGYAGTADTTLFEATPDTNAGGDDGTSVFGEIDNVDGERERALVRFDLSDVPANGTVTSAKVTFTSADPGDQVVAHEVLEDWDEAEATWNQAAAGTPWSTPGGELGAAISDPVAVGAPGEPVEVVLDTATVQGWVDDPATNFGFALVSTGHADTAHLYTSERGTEEQRPVFEIVVEVPDPVVVTTASPLPGGTVGEAYPATQLQATGGVGDYTWTVTDGALPGGLGLSPTGVLSGTPTEDGTFDFEVTATDEDGSSGSADLSLTIAPAAAAGGGVFRGITPNRVLDTRTSGPCVSGGAGREVTVAPSAGVPADATAVALNVTVISPGSQGYLTVYPTGSPRPTASNLNYTKGQVVPNLVTTKVGTGGKITVFASGGCPNVAVDVTGYYTAGAPAAGGFVGLTPNRVLDTRRAGQGPCIAGARNVTVAPSTGVPADAAAVALNVTVVQPASPGYATVYPAGNPRPTASNLNYTKGQVVPNHVTAKVGTGGNITVFTSGGCPHVIVDVAGYYTTGVPGEGGFVGVNPSRVLDTRRAGQGPCIAGARNVTVAPTAGVPANAAAAVLNVTIVEPASPGYATVYPQGVPRPTASNLNYSKGQVVPNAVITGVNGGQVTVFTSGGCPHVVVDVVGYHVGT